MRPMKTSLVLLVAAASGLLAQPVISKGGIGNAASARHGLVTEGVAPGSIIVISGERLGPPSSQTPQSSNTSLELSGVSVEVEAGGQYHKVRLLYVSEREIGAVLPSATPAGDAVVRVTRDGQISDPVSFRVSASSFAAFTLNTGEQADPVFRSVVSQAAFAIQDLPAASQPGQLVTLWGTGLGRDSANDDENTAEGELPGGVQILVDDKPAEVVYAGRTSFPGLDRISFRVPEGLDGCSLAVSVKVAEQVSIASALSVAASGAFCPMQRGFSNEDLEKARTQGGLSIGTIYSMRYGDFTSNQTYDMGFAAFSRVSWERLQEFRPVLQDSIPGACYAWSVNSDGKVDHTGPGNTPTFGPELFYGFYPFGEQALDAGSFLQLSGPSGKTRLERVAPGMYYWYAMPGYGGNALALQPGTYTIENGSDSADIKAFKANLEITAPINWTGVQDVSRISRADDFSVTWSGGGRNDVVWVYAYSMNMDLAAMRYAYGVVACSERASRGKITIPASNLSRFLPVSQTMEGYPMGALMLYSTSVSNKYEVTGGLDAAYIVNLGYAVKPVHIE